MHIRGLFIGVKLNIGKRLISGTVWLSISYCNQVKSSS